MVRVRETGCTQLVSRLPSLSRPNGRAASDCTATVMRPSTMMSASRLPDCTANGRGRVSPCSNTCMLVLVQNSQGATTMTLPMLSMASAVPSQPSLFTWMRALS